MLRTSGCHGAEVFIRFPQACYREKEGFDSQSEHGQLVHSDNMLAIQLANLLGAVGRLRCFVLLLASFSPLNPSWLLSPWLYKHRLSTVASSQTETTGASISRWIQGKRLCLSAKFSLRVESNPVPFLHISWQWLVPQTFCNSVSFLWRALSLIWFFYTSLEQHSQLFFHSASSSGRSSVPRCSAQRIRLPNLDAKAATSSVSPCFNCYTSASNWSPVAAPTSL